MLDRRTFLFRAGLTTAGLLCSDRILAASKRASLLERPQYRPIRIQGQVSLAGRGIAGVGVSDGLSVTRTAADGGYQLVSHARRPFVFVSLPAGHAIPTNPSGTARFYRPVRAGSDGEATATFELTHLAASENEHVFLLFADPQTMDQEDVDALHRETVPDARETVRRYSRLPMFGVACGDIMYDRLEYFPAYERAVEEIGIPFFQVPGNHDVEIQSRTDATSLQTFQRHFGPTYFSFDRGQIHYVVLDDVFWFDGYIGYIDQTQLEWLKADLDLVEKGRSVVVFVHIPSYCTSHLRRGRSKPDNSVVITNRELLYRLLEPYKAFVVCGHMHESEYLRDGGAEVHICGAVCGAWWSGAICYDGTPKGYSIYRAKGSELTWQYKSTGHGEDHQMRLYAPGTTPGSPRDVVANIWSADPTWQVVWYEDGTAKGAMQKRAGQDPLAVNLYSGSDRPAKHPWVDPVTTDHLFHAEPSPGAKTIVVEATDRWGNVFTEKLEL